MKAQKIKVRKSNTIGSITVTDSNYMKSHSIQKGIVVAQSRPPVNTVKMKF